MSTLQKYTEEEHVHSLQKGDEKGFGVLYASYSRALLGIIKNLVADEVIAEDILQEVFLKIWNNRNGYDPARGRLYTWMLNIARNASIDHLRSGQSRFDGNIQRSEAAVYEVNRIHQVRTSVDHIGLSSWVKQLKEEQRTLIDLAYFKGYTQEEISRELNLPLGTVKTRVRAALMTLRKLVR